jgi:two-component system, OmpR family, response regulator RpaA
MPGDMNFKEQRQVFTTGRIAKGCMVAQRTVSRWIDSGLLKGYRIPGSHDRRVTRAELLRFLAEYGMPTEWLECPAK